MHPGFQLHRADPAEVLGRHLAPGMTVAVAGRSAEVWVSRLARAVGRNGAVLRIDPNRSGAPGQSCHVVLWADSWPPGDAAALPEIRRILKHDGCLAILGGGGDAGPPVDTLERHGWTVHELAAAGPEGYILIAAPTDESVQS